MKQFIFTQPVVLKPRKNVRDETVIIEAGETFDKVYMIAYKYRVSLTTVNIWRHTGVVDEIEK